MGERLPAGCRFRGNPANNLERLRPLDQIAGLFMLAVVVPYYARQSRRTGSQGNLSYVLAPLVATHWSVAYLIALVRAVCIGPGLGLCRALHAHGDVMSPAALARRGVYGWH